MKNIRINVQGEVFDVTYEGDTAVAISRKDKRKFEGTSVYDLIDKIRKSNA